MGVPLYEASAKTGNNVDSSFKKMVSEIVAKKCPP